MRKWGLMAVLAAALCNSSQAFAADAAYGEYLAGECKGCHVLKGDAPGDIPSLDGYDGESIQDALNAYRKGERKDASEAMKSVAAALDDDQVAALGAFFDKMAKEAEAKEEEKEKEAAKK